MRRAVKHSRWGVLAAVIAVAATAVAPVWSVRADHLADSGVLVIDTIAGDGTEDDSGDGGLAIDATFDLLSAVAVAADGQVYIADSDAHRVRRIDLTGRIQAFAGTGTAGSAGDGGPADEAQLSSPNGLAVGPDGTVYISEGGNHSVRAVSPSGVISRVMGDGSAGSGLGELDSPFGLSIAPDGSSLVVADSGNTRLMRRTLGNVPLTSVLVSGLGNPLGVAHDSDGVVHVAEAGTNTISRIDGGVATVVAGSGDTGVDGDGGAPQDADIGIPMYLSISDDDIMYVSQAFVPSIRVIDLVEDTIGTFAGQSGSAGFSGDDELPTEAELGLTPPHGVGPFGELWIGDRDNRRLRRVSDVPVISIAAPAAAQRFGDSTASFTCVDAALSTCGAATDGGLGFLSGDELPTSRLGTFTLSVTATDRHLNFAADSAEFTVDWKVYGTYAGASGVDGVIVRFYIATFGRLPDNSGFAFWKGRLEAVPGDPSVPAFFTESPEFEALYGPLTEEGFLDTIYVNVLGRDPETGGREFWAGELSSGRWTRGEVMEFFAQSDEHQLITGTS